MLASKACGWLANYLGHETTFLLVVEYDVQYVVVFFYVVL